MAKRPVKRAAEEPLEDVVAVSSPLPKRARIEEVADEESPPPPPPPPEAVANGANGSHVRTATVAEQDSEDDDEDEAEEGGDEDAPVSRQAAPAEGYSDLYLDTIDRARLDFDFEKLCSVTLSNINVYACLVCGKYFSGRGPKTSAYFHALEVGHHVYINMGTKKVYVLPEGYEVKSTGLEDIKVVVDPKFTADEVKALDRQKQPA
ncbi:Ubiquitin carboxyl-terminal hydrolase 10, partial [Oleoguttula sp. CCFEE 5521]